MIRYVAYEDLDGRPNVVVDGSGTEGTVLVLSHWPGSGTPAELADDLSTQIALRYLDRPDLHVRAEAVSNNHFDEDGLCGIWCLVDPDGARARRERLVEVARFGDFGAYRDRDAARVAMALSAYEDDDRSPIASDLEGLPYPRQAALLYQELLGLLPEMLDHPDRYRALWEEEDAALERDETAVASGEIRIEERPDVDLAVVTVPESRARPHEAAVHNATDRHRILTVRGRSYEVRYRYETWVDYVSAPTMPRVDLVPLAAELTAREPGGFTWTFDGVGQITPRLSLRGGDESALTPKEYETALVDFLRRAAA